MSHTQVLPLTDPTRLVLAAVAVHPAPVTATTVTGTLTELGVHADLDAVSARLDASTTRGLVAADASRGRQVWSLTDTGRALLLTGRHLRLVVSNP